MEYVLEMKDISKTFPGVKALDHVQLQVKPGEVHALMGENGAGKSTLMKILMGIYTKDNGGEIIFNGQPYHVSNPKEAMDHGVAMIHQELNPILDMSVYENIFVGREIRKNGLVDAKAEIAEAEKLIKECGLHVSPKEKLRNLTVAQCQLIDIIKEGVALITEDRKVTGLNLSGSVNDNIAMVAIKKLLSHGLYNKNKARAASMEYIKKLNIKTPSGDQITGNLSGGNQQKIVIAKWLLNDPDVIILDEPTRGIDVGAKRDIYLLLGKLVQQGKAVIMISSEIPELMGVCDRIMVMCEGNLSGEVQRDAFSQERIMTLASAIEV